MSEELIMSSPEAQINIVLPKKRGRKLTINYKDNKNEYHKNYYHLHKDKWLKRKEQIIMCEVCNKTYRLHKRHQHMKTQKHMMCLRAFQSGIICQSNF